MIRTITIGSCISVQGVFERQQANGNIVVRVGSKTYEGKPVVPGLKATDYVPRKIDGVPHRGPV